MTRPPPSLNKLADQDKTAARAWLIGRRAKAPTWAAGVKDEAYVESRSRREMSA